MKPILILLSLALTLGACTDSSGDGDGEEAGGGSEEEEGGGGDDTGLPDDPTPVWEDARLETSETIGGIYASGAGVYAVTTGGQAWLRAGGSWTRLTVDVDDADLNGVWGAGSAESLQLVAVGDAGNVITWGASGFELEDVGTPNFEDVDGTGVANLMAVGWGGIYLNNTGAWEFLSLEGNHRYNHVWYDGANAVAVGEEGAIARYSSGTWGVTVLDSRSAIFGVDGVSANDVWAVGERGLVLHFDGTDWTEVEIDTDSSLWAVSAPGPKEVYVVGSNGEAYKYDGEGFTSLPTGVENNLYSISVSSTGGVWAAGNRGMTLKLQ